MPSGILKGLYWPYFAIYQSFFPACFKHGRFSSDGSVFTSHLISPVPFHEQPVKAGLGVGFCNETHPDARCSSGQTHIKNIPAF